jgi:hypothetical protein
MAANLMTLSSFLLLANRIRQKPLLLLINKPIE